MTSSSETLASLENMLSSNSYGGSGGGIDLPDGRALFLSLTPDVLALIADHLDFKSVVSFAGSFSGMLDALPRVTTLCIEQSSQLPFRGIVAERLRLASLDTIRISSFANDRQHDNLDADISLLALPFLNQFGSRVQRVLFGRMSITGEFICGSSIYLNFDQVNTHRMNNLMNSISGGYHLGLLPSNLRVLGLRCPQTYFQRDSPCEVCRRVCRNFPIPEVLGVHHCLSRIDALAIVGSRPGGMDYLRSPRRLFRLLGSGTISRIQYYEGKYFMVDYSEESLAEMRTVIGGLDIASLDPSEIMSAIMNSFIEYGKDLAPPENFCHLEESPFDSLSEMGLPVPEDEFLTPWIKKIENLPTLLRRLVGGGSENRQTISAMRIRWLLYDGGKYRESPSLNVVQRVIDLGVLPTLVELLQSPDNPHGQQMAARICGDIAHSNEHVNAIAEAGVYPHLLRMMEPKSSLFLRKTAAGVVESILRHYPTPRLLMLQAGVIEPLLSLVDHPFWHRRSATAISHLCRVETPSCPQLDSETIERIARALMGHSETLCPRTKYLDDEYSASIVNALGCIAKYYPSHRGFLLDVGVMEEILDHWLLLPKYVVQEATQALANLCYAEEFSPRFDSSTFERIGSTICTQLLTSQSESVLRDAIRALGYLWNAKQCDNLSRLSMGNLKNLASGQSPVKNEASFMLLSFFYRGSKEQVSFMLDNVCLEPLCEMLQHEDEHVLVTTLGGLRNALLLLQGSNKNEAMQYVLTRQILQRLVDLMLHNSDRVKKLALTIFARLFRERGPNHTRFTIWPGPNPQSDCQAHLCIDGVYLSIDCVRLIPSMIEALMEEDQDEVSHTFSAFVLTKLVIKDVIDEECTLLGLRQLADLLATEDTKASTSVLTGLETALTEYTPRKAVEAFFRAGICKQLLEMLFHTLYQVQTSAFKALCCIMPMDVSQTESLLCKTTLSRLLELLTNGCVEAQGRVCKFIYLLGNDKKLMHILLDGGFLSPLVKVLPHGHLDASIAEYAPAGILGIMSRCTSDKAELSPDCLQPMCALLQTSDDNIRFSAALGIKKAVGYHYWNDSSRAFLHVLITSGVVECLETLRKDKSFAVRVEASSILIVLPPLSSSRVSGENHYDEGKLDVWRRTNNNPRPPQFSFESPGATFVFGSAKHDWGNKEL